jgi:1,4-alpha-glucan branching enzyme
LVVCNLTPRVLKDYQLGISHKSAWQQILNSDDAKYGGSGQIANPDILKTSVQEIHGKANAITLTIAPLATMIFECVEKGAIKKV